MERKILLLDYYLILLPPYERKKEFKYLFYFIYFLNYNFIVIFILLHKLFI